MGHTPYGYRIENGRAVIDEEAAGKIRKLYENYLAGMAQSKAASEAGIVTYHCSAKHIMQNRRYLGDSFYPAIIDGETFDRAEKTRLERAGRLGRLKLKKEPEPSAPPVRFRFAEAEEQYDNPVLQAEYLYSLIESEGI